MRISKKFYVKYILMPAQVGLLEEAEKFNNSNIAYCYP